MRKTGELIKFFTLIYSGETDLGHWHGDVNPGRDNLMRRSYYSFLSGHAFGRGLLLVITLELNAFINPPWFFSYTPASVSLVRLPFDMPG